MDEISQIFRELRRSLRGTDTVAIDTAELQVKQLLLRLSVITTKPQTRGDA